MRIVPQTILDLKWSFLPPTLGRKQILTVTTRFTSWISQIRMLQPKKAVVPRSTVVNVLPTFTMRSPRTEIRRYRLPVLPQVQTPRYVVSWQIIQNFYQLFVPMNYTANCCDEIFIISCEYENRGEAAREGKKFFKRRPTFVT